MTRDNKQNKRLVALFLFGCVLLNYPILSLFNLEIMIFGLPLLYVYIFSIWGSFDRSGGLGDDELFEETSG